MPVELTDYATFIDALRLLDTADPAVRTKIIELLVHKGMITRDGFDIDFYAGESEIERGLAEAGPRLSGRGDPSKNETTDFFQIGGSKILQNGGLTWKSF